MLALMVGPGSITQTSEPQLKIKTIAGWEGWLEERSRSSTQGQENRYFLLLIRAPAWCSCSFLQATLPNLQFCKT